MTRGTKKEHLARAVLESICYQSLDVLSAMEADSNIKIKSLRVDGGATANNFIMQFQSDLLGIPVERPIIKETTALGSAYLSGLATGYWESLAEIKTSRKIEKLFYPEIDQSTKKSYIKKWRAAVKATRLFSK